MSIPVFSKVIPILKAFLQKYAIPIGKAILKEVASWLLVEVVSDVAITAISLGQQHSTEEAAEDIRILLEERLKELGRRESLNIDFDSDGAQGMLSQAALLVSLYALPLSTARNEYHTPDRHQINMYSQRAILPAPEKQLSAANDSYKFKL